MTSESMTTTECAEKARKSYKTIVRWINYGFRGKKLYAERAGHNHRVNRHTFDRFLEDTKLMGAR